jgi:hypothetical protein
MPNLPGLRLSCSCLDCNAVKNRTSRCMPGSLLTLKAIPSLPSLLRQRMPTCQVEDISGFPKDKSYFLSGDAPSSVHHHYCRQWSLHPCSILVTLLLFHLSLRLSCSAGRRSRTQWRVDVLMPRPSKSLVAEVHVQQSSCGTWRQISVNHIEIDGSTVASASCLRK